MDKIINCKNITQKIKDNVKEEISHLNYKPILVIFTDLTDDASEVYIKQKIKACEYCGIGVLSVDLKGYNNIDELLRDIEAFNKDDSIAGIMVQLPQTTWNTETIINAINPKKDVDGLTCYNVAQLHLHKPLDNYLAPCTPSGILKVLESIDFQFEGSRVLILGRSDIVGRPLAELLIQRNCTVTLAHSKTQEDSLRNDFDLIISAVGKPKVFCSFVNSNKTKPVLIDVGINRDENNKLCGDFDLEKSEYLYATPVPGGIGPMTVAMLMSNILKAIKLQNKK